MEKYNKPIKACPERRSLRAPVRALLKCGARGQTDAFLALSGLYFDLISEHLYLCNLDRKEALHKAERILLEGWKQLPAFKRLSDWERFLACSLMSAQISGVFSREGPRPQALVELDSQAKFALIAFDLENWSYPWLSLALRVQPRDLKNILFQARCRLLGIDLSLTSRKLRGCLELVSADLDGQLSVAQQRQLLKKLCACQETKAFKSGWLDFRCQLIELRQQIRLQPEERDDYLNDLGQQLAPEDMVRPSFAARVRNIFSFRELESPEVVPSDFRYGR